MLTSSISWMFSGNGGCLLLKDANGKTVHSQLYDLGEPAKIMVGGTEYVYDGTNKPAANRKIKVRLFVSEPANGTSGTLKVAIKTGSTIADGAITSARTVSEQTLTQATLVKGYVIIDGTVDHTVDRYLQIDFTGGGTLTAGAIFGEVVPIE